MAASRSDIEDWLKQGLKKKATHVIIVCDTFDYDDYPVYVSASEDVHKVYDKYCQASMQRVMEVYNLSKALGPQLNSNRAFEF